MSCCFSSGTLGRKGNVCNTQPQKMLLVVSQPFSPENAASDMCAPMEAPGGDPEITQRLGKKELESSTSSASAWGREGSFQSFLQAFCPSDLAPRSENSYCLAQSSTFLLPFFLTHVCFSSRLCRHPSAQSVFKAFKWTIPRRAQLHRTQNFILSPIAGNTSYIFDILEMVKKVTVSVLREEDEVYRWRGSTGDPGVFMQTFSMFYIPN